MPIASLIPPQVSQTLSCTSSFSHTSLDLFLFVIYGASIVMSAVIGGVLMGLLRRLAFFRQLLNLLLLRLCRFLGDGVTAGLVLFCVRGE